jgi:Ca2+-binding RTX toxin-like protein
MANMTYVFERITADQAASFDSTDKLIFIDTSASNLSVQFRAATGLTQASLTLSDGTTSVVFPAAALADASQANQLTFADGSNLVFADQAGGTLAYTASTTQNTTFYGFNANDQITATGTGDAIIHGGGGNDFLKGVDGNDYIFGGLSTTVGGGFSSDTILGGSGNDHLYGGDFTVGVTSTDGTDLIFGEGGDDYIQGNAGNDTLDGGTGQDRIYGGAGNDTIVGGTGFDTINGNMGDDIILADAGNDSIRGGQGNDDLRGHQGQDILFGDLGNDTLSGGTGIDVVTGGDGADVFLFLDSHTVAGSDKIAYDAEGQIVENADGSAVTLEGFWDSITDFAHGVDKIDLEGVTAAAGDDPAIAASVIYAQAGVTFTTVSAAQTYAQQLLDDTAATANTYEIASIQVGGDTYLFSQEGGEAAINSIIRLDGTNASTVTNSDFI